MVRLISLPCHRSVNGGDAHGRELSEALLRLLHLRYDLSIVVQPGLPCYGEDGEVTVERVGRNDLCIDGLETGFSSFPYSLSLGFLFVSSSLSRSFPPSSYVSLFRFFIHASALAIESSTTASPVGRPQQDLRQFFPTGYPISPGRSRW